MALPKTKKDVIKAGTEMLDEFLSNNGSNDYVMANTPELFQLAEEYSAWNLNMTVDEFKASLLYGDEKPTVSKDGKKIYLSDSFVVYLIKKELDSVVLLP